MESLNRFHVTSGFKQMTEMNDVTLDHPLSLTLTKSEKELRLINLNREVLEKRDEIIARQVVDVESSFDS